MELGLTLTEEADEWPETEIMMSIRYILNVRLNRVAAYTFSALTLLPVALGCDSEPTHTVVKLPEEPSPAPKKKTITSHFQQGFGKYEGTTDATLDSLTGDENFGDSSLCKIDGDKKEGSDRACLLRWDVSKIPKGSKVTGVEFRFRVLDGTAERYSIYEMTKDWVESEVTWNTPKKGGVWEKGGAMGKSDRATIVGTIRGDEGTRYAHLNDAAVKMVQRWVDGKNFGVVIADGKAKDGLDIASAQHKIDSDRPKLTVTYLR